MDLRYTNLREQAAYEQGYVTAHAEFNDQLQRSKHKILDMMLDTEPYTSQRRMLKACVKLLDIYHRHYSAKTRCLNKLSLR